MYILIYFNEINCDFLDKIATFELFKIYFIIIIQL
jgi:hypothetical protein